MYLVRDVNRKNEKWLGRFFGFASKCRLASVGFEKKNEKNRNRNRTLLGLFLGRFLGETSKKSTFQRIQCACVGITYMTTGSYGVKSRPNPT